MFFRRIGKTRLLIESLKDEDYLRIFVPKDKTVTSFLQDASEKHNIPQFTRIRDFITYIFEKYENSDFLLQYFTPGLPTMTNVLTLSGLTPNYNAQLAMLYATYYFDTPK